MSEPLDPTVSLLSAAGKPRPIKDVERDVIMFALKFYNFGVDRACYEIGLSRPVFYARLRQYGVNVRAARKESQK
jgi:DNA-binding NtrC family response regulator